MKKNIFLVTIILLFSLTNIQGVNMQERYIWNYQATVTLPANASLNFELVPVKNQLIEIFQIVVWYDGTAKDLNVYVAPNGGTDKVYYADEFQVSSTRTFYYPSVDFIETFGCSTAKPIWLLSNDKVYIQGVSLISGDIIKVLIRGILNVPVKPTMTNISGATVINEIIGVL